MKLSLAGFPLVVFLLVPENVITAHAEGAAVPVAASAVSAQPQAEADASASRRTTTSDQHEWPGIRGPQWNGNSAEVGLLDFWPAEGPPVLWTRELGQGYSAFVAWSNRIATQYQSLGGQYVICLDSDTGQTIWEYKYEWPYDPAGVYPGPRATPMYSEGLLYFASPAGVIGCLDADTGSLKWSVDLEKRFQCDVTGFGYACSPSVIDGLVLLPVGGADASMVALDARTGAVRWQSGTSAASYAPAFPVSFRGRRLVLGYMENTLVCHDRGTGELLWTHDLSQGYDEHSSWPIYNEPYLWISSPFQAGAELLELTEEPSVLVRSRMKQPLMSNDIFSSVLVHGAIYGFDVRDPQAKTHRSTRGVFRCLDFQTGHEHWSVGNDRPRRASDVTPGDEPWIGHATVIAADGKLILFNDLGELILAKTTTTGFEQLGRVSVLGGEICWTQPALLHGRLFVRNQSRAACVFLGDPSELQPTLRGTALTVADIPQQSYFDWASIILGVEPEYAFDLPSRDWLINWFWISLAGIMGGWLLVMMLIRLLPGVRRVSPEKREIFYWGLVFISGALGTTFLSPWFRDFTFTWPVAVFATWQPLIDRLAVSRKQLTIQDRMRSGVACLNFITSCAIYFVACRRLSLVFEWVFLAGFPAALPFSLTGRRLSKSVRFGQLWKAVCTGLAFTAFYWSAVAFLFLRVRSQ
jgi:outer membrane protein assembly factor BamB